MQNTFYNDAPDALPAADGFFRTPFQVLVLTYATLGFYGLYWLIRGRRLAEIRLEQSITPYWIYLSWLIPIVGIVSGCMSAGKIEWRCRRSEIPVGASFGFLTFLYFAFGFL